MPEPVVEKSHAVVHPRHLLRPARAVPPTDDGHGVPCFCAWASSFDGDFNFDFNVRFTEEQQREGGIEYNYRREAAWQPPSTRFGRLVREGGGEGPVAEYAAMCGTDAAAYTRERPGMSAFALEDGVVYHAYSAYARGLDGLWGMYQWLDRAPKGRNETGVWWRRHDEYNKR